MDLQSGDINKTGLLLIPQGCHISWARKIFLGPRQSSCVPSKDILTRSTDVIPQTVNLLSIFVFSFDGRGHVQPIFRYSGAYSTDATIINYPE